MSESMILADAPYFIPLKRVNRSSYAIKITPPSPKVLFFYADGHVNLFLISAGWSHEEVTPIDRILIDAKRGTSDGTDPVPAPSTLKVKDMNYTHVYYLQDHTPVIRLSNGRLLFYYTDGHVMTYSIGVWADDPVTLGPPRSDVYPAHPEARSPS